MFIIWLISNVAFRNNVDNRKIRYITINLIILLLRAYLISDHYTSPRIAGCQIKLPLSVWLVATQKKVNRLLVIFFTPILNPCIFGCYWLDGGI